MMTALILTILVAATVHLYYVRVRAWRDRLHDDLKMRWRNPRPTCQLLEPASPPFTKEAFIAALAKDRPRQKVQRDPLLRVSLGLWARRAKAKAGSGEPLSIKES